MTDLTLYNTRTRSKERFEPLVPGRVSLYVCGPTVYDYAHIGNARPVIVFDLLYRVLKQHYSHVDYVTNFTDVDDKINKAAAASGEDIRALTERTAAWYIEDMAALGILEPTARPRVTDHIPDIISMVERLIGSGHAYAAEGHVLFSVESMPEYGRLSGRSIDDMIAGARVDVAPYKKYPGDFVLWKPSTPDLPGWDSPWGRGRPGWHIECSAMIEHHLGETIDIHGGGSDLVFPHHENELAQSTCAHGGRLFARWWMHNGMLTVEGEKMSKSLGNFFIVRDVLKKAPGEAARFYMLHTHYRQPFDWSWETLAEMKRTLDRFYNALRRVSHVEAIATSAPHGISDALADDLNTPLAISHLHALVSELNKSDEPAVQAALKGDILGAGALLGILQQDPEVWFGAGDPDGEISALVEARIAARKAKNFAEADRIRDDLVARGIQLEDGPGGTSWKRAG